jgi:hypothetical protein
MRYKIRALIFGSLQPGTIEIEVGYDYGMGNPGLLNRVDTSLVPIDCRLPNTYVWVTMEKGEILLVEKMTAHEVEENKID